MLTTTLRTKAIRTTVTAGVLLAVSQILAGTALAADCANPRKAAGGMSEGTYKSVEEASSLIAKDKYNDAIEKLTKMTDAGSDFEKAVVWYNLGFAHSGKNDHASAAKAFSTALSLNALPQQQHEQLQYNLGQLYIVAGQPEEGIKTLQAYVAEACTPVPADAHIFLANALAERKRFKDALPQIDLALSKVKQPKESWLQLKLAIAYELKDFKSCAQTLVQIIGIAPAKPEYWKQLSSLFYEMKQDTDSVAVLALAERQGFIGKPNEIKNLYSIYMIMELPYKAGMTMQAAIDKGTMPADEKNLEAVADAWINARETKSAEATLKKLAGMSEKGEYFFKLGAMYGDEERWKESKEMLEKALAKGELKRPGEAWMRVAVASYNLKDSTATQAALRKAMNHTESRKQASEWLRHLGASSVTASNANPSG
jgi:tetratricopeptide (TPR) repeat protein